MKIVHIAPNAPYNDHWGYQENLLPKYQKKLGHEVTLIITNTMHQDGKVVEIPPNDYVLDDGVRIIRLKKKKYWHRVITGLKSKLEVFDYLCEIRPDFIFFHGLLSTTIYDVIKYKKKINPDCRIVQDNHLDYNIGVKPKSFYDKLVRAYRRHINRKSIKVVEKVYGVTPWRKQYAEDYFAIPPAKTDVLIMGADDEKIDFGHRNEARQRVRTLYGIGDNEFLIITGGKIEQKKNVHLLMDACRSLPQAKLLVFGSISEDMKEEFDSFCKDNPRIIYVGWVDADSVYDYFFASDLIVFPGAHSVLWEQACACGVPMLFKAWAGMDHVYVAGNCDFLHKDSSFEIRDKIENLICDQSKYLAMKRAAERGAQHFFYSEIAKRSLE